MQLDAPERVTGCCSSTCGADELQQLLAARAGQAGVAASRGGRRARARRAPAARTPRSGSVRQPTISMPARNASASTPIGGEQRGARARRRVGRHACTGRRARAASSWASRARSTHTVASYHGVSSRSVASSQAEREREPGRRRARAACRAAARACKSPSVMPRPERRVRARPRVGEQRHAGDSGRPSAGSRRQRSSTPPIAMHARHRLAVEPVRVQRARAHDGGQRGLVAEPLQRRVAPTRRTASPTRCPRRRAA